MKPWGRAICRKEADAGSRLRARTLMAKRAEIIAGGGEELSPRLGKRHFDATLQALAVASIFYHVWAIHNAGYGKPDLDRF